MKPANRVYSAEARDLTHDKGQLRIAVGYIRVSTDMQASEGLSLDAQTAAIEHYCAAHDLQLVRICKDVIFGGKADRPGLDEALASLQRGADVLVVLKFDRLSRSIRHFCELYERYFKSGEKELVAIRESIRLDSSLGRALVSILLVFAQMERESTAERTREAVRHIKQRGYHHGKVPYGYKKVPAPDQPRFTVLVEDPEGQMILARIKQWLDMRRDVLVADRYADWQAIHADRVAARRRDPAQTLNEQAYAAALAARWRLVDHPHQRLGVIPAWRLIGCLLDETCERYLLTITQERLDEMQSRVGEQA